MKTRSTKRSNKAATQRRRGADCESNERAVKRSTSSRVLASTVPLSDVGERLVLSFLPYVPDRARLETVCRRWLDLSRHHVPIDELDFSRIANDKVTKNVVKALLQRANRAVERLVVPTISFDDSLVQMLAHHPKLRHIQAYTFSRGHILSMLEACQQLRSLEILDCQMLSVGRWNAEATRLESIFLNACHVMKTQGITSLIGHCKQNLKRLVLTGAEQVDSSVFRALERHNVKIEELTLTFSREVRYADMQTLAQASWDSLRVLDLSSCSGLNRFPDTTILQALQVLVADNTKINDSALRSIGNAAPQLKYLSLQDCRSLTDDGFRALCDNSTHTPMLEILDVKVRIKEM